MCIFHPSPVMVNLLTALSNALPCRFVARESIGYISGVVTFSAHNLFIALSARVRRTYRTDLRRVIVAIMLDALTTSMPTLPQGCFQ